MNTTFRLGIFLILAFSILAISVLMVGRQETHFGSSHRLRTEFQTVSGLNEGAEVRVGGMHRGTVRSILLPKRSDGRIQVVMDLDKDTQEVVRKDSQASIQADGLLGDKYVEVSFGSVEGDRVKGGETIEQAPA